MESASNQHKLQKTLTGIAPPLPALQWQWHAQGQRTSACDRNMTTCGSPVGSNEHLSGSAHGHGDKCQRVQLMQCLPELLPRAVWPNELCPQAPETSQYFLHLISFQAGASRPLRCCSHGVSSSTIFQLTIPQPRVSMDIHRAQGYGIYPTSGTKSSPCSFALFYKNRSKASSLR